MIGMKEYLDQYKKSLTDAIWAIEEPEFAKAVEILRQAWFDDKQVFIMGNGGSAGTANHFVCDFGKNAVQAPKKRRFRVLSVCDNIEKVTALGNLMNDGDVLIAVSASGNSPDLVRACEFAAQKHAHIITLSGFEGGKIKAFAEAAFVVRRESYEQIEDVHLNILHMLTYYFKTHPECLEA